ncbi:hypothetical protein [Flavobacterium sp.]|uniref:hypothetical protein n=1 Tax=Flavobacterium sp. TaxID=239 RepID=UPI0037517BBB
MNKIKLILSKDFRILFSILGILTWILTIFTIVTFFVVLFDCAIHNSFIFPSSQGIYNFLSIHKKFNELYGATVTLIIAYTAVKQYLNSNTLQTLDFFFEKLVPTANATIYKATNEHKLKLLTPNLEEYLKNKSINFTVEELNEIEPELKKKLVELHLTNLDFQKDAVLTLGYFESFSIKLTKGLVNNPLIENACSKAFCIQVRNLYPLISLTRSENDLLYFTTVVHLYNKWKHVLAT